jgi:hypothetical protein
VNTKHHLGCPTGTHDVVMESMQINKSAVDVEAAGLGQDVIVGAKVSVRSLEVIPRERRGQIQRGSWGSLGKWGGDSHPRGS